MAKTLKITDRHMLSLLALAVPKGLTKNEIIQMCEEKFGVRTTDSLIYNILGKLMVVSDSTSSDQTKKPFVRRKEVFKDRLSRRRHFKYAITLEGLEKLAHLEGSLGKMLCRESQGTKKTRRGVSVADFLSMRIPSGALDQEG